MKLVCNNDLGLVWHKHIFIVIGDKLLSYRPNTNAIKLLHCPEMELPDADEMRGTHQCGFQERGMSRAFEACGKVTASVGCPSPLFLFPLPLWPPPSSGLRHRQPEKCTPAGCPTDPLGLRSVTLMANLKMNQIYM